jgi:leader peptidase (prepilin peptidase)/N-methyltransferase
MILFCCFTILFLFFLSIEDLKSRRVRLLPALIFADGMFLAHLILKDLPLKELLWGILLGAGLFAVSLITHSAIGGGDALAVLSCASALGGSAEFAALLLSLLLSALFSIFLLLRRKISRKDSLPFLPFLLAGHLILTLTQFFRR